GALGLTHEDNPIKCAIRDAKGEFAFFGTGSGDILKIHLADLNPAGNLTVRRDEDGFASAVLEPGGQTALFVTAGEATTVVRINLAALEIEKSVSVTPSIRPVLAAFADERKEAVLLVSGGTPSKIIVLSLKTLQKEASYDLPKEIGKVTAVV